MLVPERLLELMTPDERENYDAVLDGWRHSPIVKCPTCGEEYGIRLRIQAGAVFIDKRAKEEATAKLQKRPSSESAVIEAAKHSGVLAAFTEAVKTEKEHGGVPADIEEFFLLFWKTAKPIPVSAVVLAAWIEEFGGRIDVWQSNGIIAIMGDGLLLSFFPNRLTQPASMNVPGRPKVSNAASFDMWRRGKFGYVPIEARGFGEALRQRNIGAFGAIVQ